MRLQSTLQGGSLMRTQLLRGIIGGALAALLMTGALHAQDVNVLKADTNRYMRDRPGGRGDVEKVPDEFSEPETKDARESARRLEDAGDDRGAEALLLETLKRFPRSSLTFVELAAVYQRQERWDDQWNAAYRAWDLAPKSPLAVFSVAVAAGSSNDHDSAVSWYSQAIKLDPNFGLAYYGRGLEHFRGKQYRQAIPDFERVAALMPESKYATDAARYIAEAKSKLPKQSASSPVVGPNQ